jgi:transposase
VLTPTPVTWDSALLPLAQLQQMTWPTQPLRVWTQDESRFGLITIQRRRLTLRGIKPLAPSQHELEWSYLYGCVEPLTGENFFLALPALDSALFQLFLNQFAQEDPTALHLVVLDNGPAHIAQQVARPANVRFVFTPPYTPEVNPMERVWEDLDARIAGATPATLDALVDLLFAELRAYTPAQLASLTGYPFFKNAVYALSSI